MEEDIYYTATKLETLKRNIQSMSYGQYLLGLIDHLRIEKNISIHRQRFYAGHGTTILRAFFDAGVKPTDPLTRQDVEKVLSKLLSRSENGWTRQGYALVLKKLVQYIRAGVAEADDDHPWVPEIRWIKPNRYAPDEDSTVTAEDLLTTDEILAMLDTADNERDRAILWVMFECALAPSELLLMKIGSVEFKEKYAIVKREKTKTGRPKVLPLVLGYRALLDWLEVHPKKDYPEGWLWLAMSTNYVGKRLSYNGLRSIVRRCAQRAGIKKRVWNYLLRHTQLTMMAKRMKSLAALTGFGGWKQGSRMLRRYIHLSGRDVEEAVLEMHGLMKKDEATGLTIKVCPRCRNAQSPEAKRCRQCGFILDINLATKHALREAKQQKQVEETVSFLLEKFEKIEDQVEKLLSAKS